MPRGEIHHVTNRVCAPTITSVSADITSIRARLDETRAVTESVVAPLDDDALQSTPRPFMSPPVWDLGHIAAYEELWIAQRLLGRPSRHPELQAAYDAFETPRARRTQIPILGPEAARTYLADVREATVEALHAVDLCAAQTRSRTLAFDMVAQHEAQHTETLLQTLQLIDDGGYRPRRIEAAREAPATLDRGRVEIAGGEVLVGAGERGFAYDCERPRHPRRVEAFAIGRHPVTNAEHQNFMADGGYTRPELWTADGWRWRVEEAAEAPLYWRRDPSGWLRRSFDQWLPVEPDSPVCHVSWFEADAHARWAGGRLPTEWEWERAACADPSAGATWPWGESPPAGRANLGVHSLGPAPIGTFDSGAGPSGCEQMLGDVWEWTSLRLHRLPRLSGLPLPASTRRSSSATGYKVLRGGAWATRPRPRPHQLRNWDLPSAARSSRAPLRMGRAMRESRRP